MLIDNVNCSKAMINQIYA